MVLVIDPQIAGLSGDMLLSSLVDLGAKKSKVISGVNESENYLKGSKIDKIDFKKINKNGIVASRLILNLDEQNSERKGIEIQNCIKKTAQKIGLSEKGTKFAMDSIDTLISAEAKIHGVQKNLVHFHEASSIDTVIDIMGTAIAMDDLNLFAENIVTMPVNVGNSTVEFSHGVMSNPAGAILEIFKKSKILIRGTNINGELTTPTGASMLVNLTNQCLESYPIMNVQSIGYGAGEKNFNGFSNVLKLTRGHSPSLNSDSVMILETNVDDVSGEILGHVIDKIMQNGAKDIHVIPTITKKGRPGHIISVMCDSGIVNELLDILISETGTLGVRVNSSDRFIVSRQVLLMKVHLNNKDFTIHYKTTNDKKQFKVEYEDIKLISKKLSLPFKQVEEQIKLEIKKQLK